MKREYNKFEINFNRSIEIRVQDKMLTSDTGALLLREVDEKLGLIESLGNKIRDYRDAGKVDHSLQKLFRQRIYSIIQGYRDQNDAESLKHDPAFAVSTSDEKGEKALENELASQATMSRLGLEMLSYEGNRESLNEGLLEWTWQYLSTKKKNKLKVATIDIDSSFHETHGSPEGAFYNAHYGAKGYHPYYAFLAETGTMLKAELRPGNVHAANGAVEFITDLIEHALDRLAKRVYVRGDAGNVSPEMLSGLEAYRDAVRYMFRLSSNPRLEALAKPHLDKVELEKGEEKVFEMRYQADTWSHARRVVLVVVQNHEELFPEHFFLVTNFRKKEMKGRQMLDFYRQRGTFESWIGEFKTTINPRFPSDKMCTNEVHLLLFGLAYNLSRIMALMSKPINEPMPRLSTVRDRLLKVAGLLVRSARRLIFDVPRTAFEWWSRFFNRLEVMKPVPI